MRLLLHRGQALLLVVVGLAGAAAVGAALERDGLPTPVATRAANLVAPRRSDLPARIVIASRASAQPPRAEAAPAAVAPSDSPTVPSDVPTAQPSPTTAVVPPVVYTYPPDSHGGGGSGRSGRGGHD